MKAAVQAMAVAESEGSFWAKSEPTGAGSKIVGPTLMQPKFDWGSKAKYVELRNFR